MGSGEKNRFPSREFVVCDLHQDMHVEIRYDED
jgi:hypothetical protein